MNVLQSIHIKHQSNQKCLAVLIDPDNLSCKDTFNVMLEEINVSSVDYIFVGGSLTVKNNFEEAIQYIQSKTSIPVVIFPGSIDQLSPNADALLFLSLISGRNPELLIGNQVVTAPKIRAMQLEAIPTGYMLIDGGRLTTANYISNTLPIPNNKPDIAMATAIAGEMLGMKTIYMDAGSGADHPIPSEMIKKVRQNINLPLIIGGGINNAEQARIAWQAGADVVVIGTAFEKNKNILETIAQTKAKMILAIN